MRDMWQTKGILQEIWYVQDMFEAVIVKRRNSRHD